MKLKNATFVELYLEKILIAAAVLIALVVIVLFVLRRPTVTIGSKELGPSEVDEEVLSYAQQLQQRLNSEQGIVDPDTGRPLEIKRSSLSDDFQQLASITRTFPLQTKVAAHIEGPGAAGDVPERPFAIPTPPVPSGMQVSVNAGTLALYQAPEIEAAYRGLYGWAPQEPRDIVGGVTVSAVFDPAEWKARLASASGGTRLSSSMERQAQRLAGVLLLRQRLDPLTGEWIDTTVVDTAPEQIGYGKYALQAALGLGGEPFNPEIVALSDTEAREISGALVVQAQAVTQTPAPQLSNGFWRMPDGEGTKELSQADYAEIDKIRDNVKKKQKQLEQTRLQLEQHQRREDLRRAREARSGGNTARRPNRSVGADDFDGGSGFRGGSSARAPQDRGQELQARAQQTEQEIQALFNEVMVLMGWVDEQQDPLAFAQQEQVEQQRVVVGPGTRQVVQEKIDVWAHDLTVEPGNTYRYKIVVLPLNPLFRNVGVPDAQKAENFNRVVIAPSAREIEAMPWSKQVVINDTNYFFYTGGSASQQTARFEVWRFYNGQWRVGEIETQQGDQLAGTIEYELNPSPSSGFGSQGFGTARQTQPGIIQVFQLPVDTQAIFMELIESTVEATGRQIQTARYLDPNGALAARNLEDDRLSIQRRKLNSLEWLASEPMLQAGADGARRNRLLGDDEFLEEEAFLDDFNEF